MWVRGGNERFHDAAIVIEHPNQIGAEGLYKWSNSDNTNPAFEGTHQHWFLIPNQGIRRQRDIRMIPRPKVQVRPKTLSYII